MITKGWVMTSLLFIMAPYYKVLLMHVYYTAVKHTFDANLTVFFV